MTKRSSTKPPRSHYVFFTDRDLGNIIPDALLGAGFVAERHDRHFGPKTLDEEWLPEVASRGWIALSRNRQIRHVTTQRDAAMNSGLALFFLIGKLHHRDMTKNLVATVPRLLHFREKNSPPFIANVYRPEPEYVLGAHAGRIEMRLTERQWREGSIGDEDTAEC
ncbi:MAG TPA: hypothetical protein VGM82_02160 [Gemmatimonadaceae bacterium]